MAHDQILALYERLGSVKAVHAETGFSECVVRKALITAGAYETETSAEIARIEGHETMTDAQIADILGISLSCANSNRPYSKGTYLTPCKSPNARRIKKCREAKKSRQSATP